mmetsp:Transcript_16075/g.22891  ORF Transcript_16075/g.22891 Transcript_16075/m.22891 type:complete len:365 (+) Transcript_16075:208-1302(+)
MQSMGITSLSSNPQLIGSLWVASSSIFTTYSTTAFLKYGTSDMIGTRFFNAYGRRSNDFQSRQFAISTGDASAVEKVRNPSEITLLDRPKLLTLYRFGGSLLFGLIINPNVSKIFDRISSTLHSAKSFALPAIFLFIANFCNTIALSRIGISLTYTSKCGIPLITVFLTLLFDGRNALPSSLALLSLVPIAIGIALASWNSPTFEKVGFLAAMISSTSQAALNVSSKRSMVATQTNSYDSLRAMAFVGFLIALSVVQIEKLITKNVNSAKMKRNAYVNNSSSQIESPPKSLALVAVLAYHAEYNLSFKFIELVNPITYGTCDAIRRLSIIIAGRRMFGGDQFSILNYLGIALALTGALGYSISR